MKAPVKYIADFIHPFVAKNLFKQLWDELDWVDRAGPRLEYYCNHNPSEQYTYGEGKFARIYQPQPVHDVIKDIWLYLERAGYTMDMCFLNGYRDGKDHLGWHADVTDDTRPIAIVSLGAVRDIWFRKNPSACYACNGSGRYDAAGSPTCGACEGTGRESNEQESLLLGNGSLCLMLPGMQKTHQHRIPKSSLHECGPRISLTFRGRKKA